MMLELHKGAHKLYIINEIRLPKCKIRKRGFFTHSIKMSLGKLDKKTKFYVFLIAVAPKTIFVME